MSDIIELEICQGKYHYRYENGHQEVWRNGVPWTAMTDNLVGNKFVVSLAVELDEANKQIERLRAEVDALRESEEGWRQQAEGYMQHALDYQAELDGLKKGSMTIDEICNLLGWPANANPESLDLLRRIIDVVDEAVKQEREACIKIVTPTLEHRQGASWGYLGGDEGVELLDEIAAVIRARGNP